MAAFARAIYRDECLKMALARPLACAPPPANCFTEQVREIEDLR